MSRYSRGSFGSDAEVQWQFDQPFDYDYRQHGLDQQGDIGHEDEDDDESHSDAGSDVSSLDSFNIDPHLPPDPSSNPPPPRTDPIDDLNDQSNQAICRICLESSSGDDSLGRLLSPCKCKGTMKYVHSSCLDQWRAASARSSSAVACDQCGAPYRFRKSKFVGIATSPTLLFVVSLVLFLLLIWSVGVVATLCMDLYDRPAAPKAKTKSSGWWPWRGASLDADSDDYSPIHTDAWSYLDADYTTPGLWSYNTLMYEPAAYIKLIKLAVRSFASGEAVDAVREVVGLRDSAEEPEQIIPVEAEEEQRGFWSNLKNEWMYGDGGLWQRSSSVASPSQETPNVAPNAPGPAAPAPRQRERYDARAASDADDIHAVRRRRQRSAKTSRRATDPLVEPKGLLNKLFVQCRSRILPSSLLRYPSTDLFHLLCTYSLGGLLTGWHPLLRQSSRWSLVSRTYQSAQLWSRPFLRSYDLRR